MNQISFSAEGTKTLNKLGQQYISDTTTLDKIVESIASSSSLQEKYKESKNTKNGKFSMPSVLFSICAPKGTLVKGLDINGISTGYYCYDIDKNGIEGNLELINKTFKQLEKGFDGLIIAAHSFNGNLWCVVRGPETESKEEHKWYWHRIRESIPKEINQYIDKTGSAIAKHRYVCPDENIIYNPRAVEMMVQPYVPTQVLKKERIKPVSNDVLDFIPIPDSYDEWLSWIFTFKAAGFSFEEVEKWCQSEPMSYKNDLSLKWDGLIPEETQSQAWHALEVKARLEGWVENDEGLFRIVNLHRDITPIKIVHPAFGADSGLSIIAAKSGTGKTATMFDFLKVFYQKDKTFAGYNVEFKDNPLIFYFSEDTDSVLLDYAKTTGLLPYSAENETNNYCVQFINLSNNEDLSTDYVVDIFRQKWGLHDLYPDLIIFDTVSTFADIEDWNDAGKVNKKINPLLKFSQDENTKVPIWLLAHTPKNITNMTLDHIYGSGQFKAKATHRSVWEPIGNITNDITFKIQSSSKKMGAGNNTFYLEKDILTNKYTYKSNDKYNDSTNEEVLDLIIQSGENGIKRQDKKIMDLFVGAERTRIDNLAKTIKELIDKDLIFEKRIGNQRYLFDNHLSSP